MLSRSSYFPSLFSKQHLSTHLKLTLLCCSLFGCSLIPFHESGQHTSYHPTNHIQLSLAYLEAGDLVMARATLLDAEKHNPNDSHIQTMLAYCLEKAGEWQMAEDYYLNALNSQKSGATYNNYGCFLCERGQYQKAEAQFLKAISDNHYVKSGSAYENAGLCAMRASDTKKAIYYLQKATQHNPRLEKSRLALSQLQQKDTPQLAPQ